LGSVSNTLTGLTTNVISTTTAAPSLGLGGINSTPFGGDLSGRFIFEKIILYFHSQTKRKKYHDSFTSHQTAPLWRCELF
jgi:hypothetical protein